MYAVEGIRRDSENHADVVEILLDAASVDAHAAELLRFAPPTESPRWALREGRDAAGATDVLWYCLGLSSWRVLVRENHWDWDTAERWLRKQTVSAFIQATFEPAAGESVAAGARSLTMRQDGNLVVSDQDHKPRWAAGNGKLTVPVPGQPIFHRRPTSRAHARCGVPKRTATPGE
ncbi:hypothetical protein [Streptomyces asiaticus]|uniref:hypothetical protein n=1 Tax=Streptomyces asiaticus TaxID=114695 RepID=UPI003F680D47